MNSNASHASSSLPDTATGLMRRDFVTAALVEQSIALQNQAGTRYAAVFLDYKGVPVEVALRVLLRPQERRKTIGVTANTVFS